MPDEYTLVLSEFITSGQCFIDCKAICKLYAGLSKVAGCLVSICWLLCLAFLYRWRFLNKISLAWPLTLTTQPSTSNLSDNPLYNYTWLVSLLRQQKCEPSTCQQYASRTVRTSNISQSTANSWYPKTDSWLEQSERRAWCPRWGGAGVLF